MKPSLRWSKERPAAFAIFRLADVIEKVLRTAELSIEDAEEAWAALRAYPKSGADVAGCLLGESNLAMGCDAMATFDRKAAGLEAFERLHGK